MNEEYNELLNKYMEQKEFLINVISILLKISPEHEGFVRVNFPEYFKLKN
jgi:hypothetical protein